MEAHSKRIKIVVADDSPFYRKLVESALDLDEFELFFAKNGSEAIDLVSAHDPAVVITDWEMPDVTGLELCEQLRRQNRNYTYIILLTSNTKKGQIVQGLEAGADDYLTKPFDPGELLARIRVGWRLAELQRQVQAKNKLLEELALTDALTGLPNRRAIELWAARELNAAARHDFSFWVVMADLDHFKTINDTYGHHAGDQVLKEFSAIMKARTRASNMCGRIGGEEFVMALTHNDQDGVQIAIERVRHELESRTFTLGGVTVRVTASFGIAVFQGKKAPEFVELLHEADAALYAAKRRGRNRIEFSRGDHITNREHNRLAVPL
jgi:two-component system cell cycle response regulator